MSALDDLANSLLAAIGDNHDLQEVKRWIDTGSPELNRIISGKYDGGLPVGRLVEVYGPSSAGKTAKATEWMVTVQKMGGVAIFIDWERSFNVSLAQSFGLNIERPYWIYAKPKTWEEGNTLAAKAVQLIRRSKAIPDDAPIIVVFDSIASAIPQSVRFDPKTNKERDVDSYNMNDTTALARVTSTTLKVMAQYAEDYDATFVYLNQIRTKIGVMFGDPTTTPGGGAMEYFASARLALGRTILKDTVDGEKQFVGQDIKFKAVKSKFTKPFQEATERLVFDELGVARFDHVASLLDLLINKGLIEYNKPRVTWTDGKKYFVKELTAKLNAEPDGMAQLKAFLPKKSADSEAEAV